MDISKYPSGTYFSYSRRHPVGIIMTSRGCAHACKFCASPNFYGRKLRFRSPQNVVSEIEYLIKRFHVKEIYFSDDNLTAKRSHIETICNLVLEKKINIFWSCNIRADTTNDDITKLMRKSGCYAAIIGVESANDDILRNINKRESVEQMMAALNIAHKNKIKCHGSFILGLPGETKQSIENTIRFSLRAKLYSASFYLFKVMPGSDSYNELGIPFNPSTYGNFFNATQHIPNGLTSNYLTRKMREANLRFYLRPVVLFRLLARVDLRYLFMGFIASFLPNVWRKIKKKQRQ